MVGMIIKFEDLSENILKKFFEDIDYSNIDFLVKYWESYGDDLKIWSLYHHMILRKKF